MSYSESPVMVTIHELLEVIRTAPEGDEAREASWALWMRVEAIVVSRIARMRPPATAIAMDFREDVLGDARGRFLRNVRNCMGEATLPGFLGTIARTTFLDALKREHVRARGRVNPPSAEDAGSESDAHEDFYGATYEADAEFDGARVDPSVSSELAERSIRLLQALAQLAGRAPRRRKNWVRAARAVRLRIVEDKPRSEVAEALGVSERQTDRYISEGLSALQEILGEEYGVTCRDDL